jgi:LysR family glycine cleavage system transcriptional activator
LWSDDTDREHFDLDIRYGSGNWAGCRADRLSWEVLEPLCSPALMSGKQAICRPADLVAARLLHVMGYEDGWAVWLKAAGLGHINAGQGIHFDSSLVAFEVAANGGGVALGRQSMSAKEIATGRLVRPFDLAVPVDEAFHLVTTDAGRVSPEAELFRSWLLEQVNLAYPAASRH